jgi:CTP synthase (UTP-ammonia lyase)
LGLAHAAHGEADPGAVAPLIRPLDCSLVSVTQRVRLLPGTHARAIYQAAATTEPFRCSYGLNPAYRDRLDDGPLQVAGVGPGGEVRLVELAGHPFFFASLYVPQLSSRPGQPHPLIVAYLQAALRRPRP